MQHPLQTRYSLFSRLDDHHHGSQKQLDRAFSGNEHSSSLHIMEAYQDVNGVWRYRNPRHAEGQATESTIQYYNERNRYLHDRSNYLEDVVDGQCQRQSPPSSNYIFGDPSSSQYPYSFQQNDGTRVYPPGSLSRGQDSSSTPRATNAARFVYGEQTQSFASAGPASTSRNAYGANNSTSSGTLDSSYDTPSYYSSGRHPETSMSYDNSRNATYGSSSQYATSYAGTDYDEGSNRAFDERGSSHPMHEHGTAIYRSGRRRADVDSTRHSRRRRPR